MVRAADQVLDKTVQNVAYSHAKAGQWNTEAAEAILKRLAGLGKPYKFIGTSTALGRGRGELGRTRARSECLTGPGLGSGLGRAGAGNAQTVGCTVLPKTTTTGLHTAHAFYWDSAHDVSALVRWENKHVYCIANVFAIRL